MTTDVLIRKSDLSVCGFWLEPVMRLDHPDKPGGALAAGVGGQRPIDFGDFVLAAAAGTPPAFNPATHSLGDPTFDVAQDFTATATWAVIAIVPDYAAINARSGAAGRRRAALMATTIDAKLEALARI